MDKTELLLKSLTEAHGAPGDESEVRSVMAANLPGYATVTTDRLGSLIAEVPGKSASPRVLVGAHMDEVGFVVREITKEGFIKVLPLGGWWGHTMLAHRVLVQTRKGPVVGIFGSQPPHLLADEDRKKVIEPKAMFIDVGAMDGFDVVKKLGVRKGDFVTPISDFQIMGNNKLYLAKAFDNRIACALVCDVLSATKPKTLAGPLFGVGSVQEEVGLRGAATSVWAVDPDLALIIDVGIARDTPGSEGGAEERLGSGVSIGVFDAGMIPHKSFLQLVIDTAEKNKIKYHLSSMERGATDGGRMHVSRSGVPAVSIGPAVRYIHSHNSIFARSDYDATLKLALAVIKRLDEKTVAGMIGLTRNAKPAAKAGKK